MGPTDSGKSTLSKILIGYAGEIYKLFMKQRLLLRLCCSSLHRSARSGHTPVYLDVDIGQGSITLPGMLAALVVDKPVPVGVREIAKHANALLYFSDSALLLSSS